MHIKVRLILELGSPSTLTSTIATSSTQPRDLEFLRAPSVFNIKHPGGGFCHFTHLFTLEEARLLIAKALPISLANFRALYQTFPGESPLFWKTMAFLPFHNRKRVTTNWIDQGVSSNNNVGFKQFLFNHSCNPWWKKTVGAPASENQQCQTSFALSSPFSEKFLPKTRRLVVIYSVVPLDHGRFWNRRSLRSRSH